MKSIFKIFFASFSVVLSFSAEALTQRNFFDYTVKSIKGEDFPLSQLKGKKIMVVNVASKCGRTKQYAQLQALYEKYGSEKFVIIGFPANNFLGQEPGTNDEIAKFCTLNYGVTFPMMAKISVKGNDIAPIYQWLTKKSLNNVGDFEIDWNFHKFLINPDGTLAASISSKTLPDALEIVSWIEK